MFQGVTHRGSLKGKDFILNEYLRGIVAFEEHLGPIFVQVSDTFSPKRKDELFNFLRSLPTDLQFFLEVRHPGWFDKENIREELFSTLKEMNTGAVIPILPAVAIALTCIFPFPKLLYVTLATACIKQTIQELMIG